MRSFVTQARSRTSLGRSVVKSFSVTPDYNTSVNVADIKLAKLTRKSNEQKITPIVSGNDTSSSSLIPETLEQMENDEEFQLTAEKLKQLGQKKLTLEERKKRRRALDDMGVPSFHDFLAENSLQATRAPTTILQLNIGLYCNQACNHCHVESSPKRTEMMDRVVADRCLELLASCSTITTLDITGGAPELNDQFRYLVTRAREIEKEQNRKLEIIDRCNLTVLLEPDQEDLPQFLALNKVTIAASLPCYSSKNVNLQRGNKVFERSIQGLQHLNREGYGQVGSDLKLDLVYNPLGAFLPPPQDALEVKYKEELMEHFGIRFSSLYTMTNMPIKRFADFLYRRKELSPYLDLLVRNFNPDTVSNLMCTNTVSVGWDGNIYDCDFNQQLGFNIPQQNNHNVNDDDDGGGTNDSDDGDLATTSLKSHSNVFSINTLADLSSLPITTDSHCFGCTAGMGSS